MRIEVLAWACVVVLGGGCGKVPVSGDGGTDASDLDPSLVEVALIPGTINSDVDLLFVIDDSPSMLDKQTNLKNSFPVLVQALASGGSLPNLHIGVVTTDMGVQGTDDATFGTSIGSGPGMCAMAGKDGALQTQMSALVAGTFISDVNGVKNYTGTLEAAFASIASTGANGCGFEQPLHAMARSFSNQANVGFLREQARLAIIVLADEDDCSVSHSTMFSPEMTTLGPLQSFRCTRYGVQCDVGGATTDEMNTIGAKTGCHSNERSDYMSDLGRYKTLLEGVKDDPRDVVFTAIVGDPDTIEVEVRTPPGGGAEVTALKRACMYQGAAGTEVADPAVRLAQVATSARRGSYTSICTPNLGGVMTAIGQRIKALTGVPCVERPIALPARCEVFDVYASGGQGRVPACSGTSGSPCYSLTSDATTCPAAQNLKVSVTRTDPVAGDTWTSVRCAL